jgi:hypothetical protein
MSCSALEITISILSLGFTRIKNSSEDSISHLKYILFFTKPTPYPSKTVIHLSGIFIKVDSEKEFKN